MVEIIGYIASVAIALSLLMTNVLKLRIINLVGALIFVYYGYLINAKAVMAVNLFIAFVDIYYIYRLKHHTSVFRFLKTGYPNVIVKEFIRSYYDDIVKYFPKFPYEDETALNYYLIVRNFMVVGLFAYKKIDENNFEIVLDYIVKDWRDLKNAISFFNYIHEIEEFRGKTFSVSTTNTEHQKYLLRIGFNKISDTEFKKQI